MLVRNGRRANPASGEWLALAESAQRAGLSRDARKMSARVVRALVDEGQHERAIALCKESELRRSGGLRINDSSDVICERALWASAEHLERWHAVAPHDGWRDPEIRVLQECLAQEVVGSWGDSVPSAERGRSFFGRLVRIVRHRRVGPNYGARVWRALVYAQRRRADLPGGALQAARCLASSEWWATRYTSVLSAARSGSRTTEDTVASEVLLALIAVHLAWGGVVDAEVAVHALELRSGFSGGRPGGVRRWEWQIATHALEARVGQRPLSRSIIGEALRMLDAADAELPVRSRGKYRARARLPWVLALEPLDWTSGEAVQAHESPRGSAVAAALRKVGADDTLDEALTRCVQLAIAHTSSERGVLIYDRGDGRPRAKVVGRGAEVDGNDVQVCHSVLARAEAQGSVLVIDDAVGDPTLADRPSVKRFRTRSVAVVPLTVAGRRMGYLYLETRSAQRSLTAEEVAELAAAGEEVGTQLEMAALRDDCRALKRERERLLEQADRSDELAKIGRHVGEMVHELRNALTVVLGEAELTLGDGTCGDAARRSLEVIRTQALDSVSQLQRLLDLIRGGGGAERSVVDPYSVAEEVLLACRSRLAAARTAGAEIAIHLSGVRGLEVLCVASELREVMTNLVVNAIDAMPTGGVLRVAVEASTASGVVIRVEDTGVGMDATTLARAFDPFFSTKGRRGNGLGLAICRSIAHRHGGSIDVASTVGVGSTFKMTLPRHSRHLGAGALLDAIRS